MASAPEEDRPMSIELTEEQRLLVERHVSQPVEVVDPRTNRRYVLLARELYERVRSLLGPNPAPAPREPAETAADLIPPGILRSQQAFWRDLPALLRDRKNKGKWVCYHGDERVGIAPTGRELIGECLRRGLGTDECHLDVIEPRALAPWEVEEVEPLGPQHLDGYPPQP
jgi:hypothetical protein